MRLDREDALGPTPAEERGAGPRPCGKERDEGPRGGPFAPEGDAVGGGAFGQGRAGEGEGPVEASPEGLGWALPIAPKLTLLLASIALLSFFAGKSTPLAAAFDRGPSRRGAALASSHLRLPGASSASTPEVAPTLQALAGATLVGGRAYGFLRELTEGYGPRLTGSPAHRQAARWALETFRTMGVDDARLEEFELKSGWERGPVTLRMVEPFERQLSAEALGWAPSPAGGPLRAEVVLVESLGEAAARAAELSGKALLFARADTTRDLAARKRAIGALSEAGVAALLSRGSRYNNAANARACYGCGDLVAPLPMVEIGFEDAALLERSVKEGTVTVDLTNLSRLTGPVKVPNVVADIRGRELPDEYVLVGAHLDSWDFATGAQDDGAGIAQVLEAARALIASGERPRRSIRFALWAGEEQGLYGSRAYAKAHAGELDRLVAVVNADHGAGAPRGWWLDARPDLLDSLGPLAKNLFAGLGAADLKDEFRCDTDHCPFVLEGVPTFNLDVDDEAYDDVHHAVSDTIDEVNERHLAAGAACVVTAAYALADLPERVGPRLSHAEVTENLRASGALDDLIAEGLYEP